jgi:hypothetical protein
MITGKRISLQQIVVVIIEFLKALIKKTFRNPDTQNHESQKQDS